MLSTYCDRGDGEGMRGVGEVTDAGSVHTAADMVGLGCHEELENASRASTEVPWQMPSKRIVTKH